MRLPEAYNICIYGSTGLEGRVFRFPGETYSVALFHMRTHSSKEARVLAATLARHTCEGRNHLVKHRETKQRV